MRLFNGQLFSLPLGARLGELLGVGTLLGLLLAVPLASVLKTLLDEAYLRLQPSEPPSPPTG